MIITTVDIGKKFNGNWIFRDVNIKIGTGQTLVLKGPNGSGKSTLLQILINCLTPSKGSVSYSDHSNSVDEWEINSKINFCGPYSEIIEELTLCEHLEFHSKFKTPTIRFEDMIHSMKLDEARDKPVSQFSSGMKQRLKLGLQFFFASEILALDEPTTNLDDQGTEWYRMEIDKLQQQRIILIASNVLREYDFFENKIELPLKP